MRLTARKKLGVSLHKIKVQVSSDNDLREAIINGAESLLLEGLSGTCPALVRLGPQPLVICEASSVSVTLLFKMYVRTRRLVQIPLASVC